jgi:hypothetical protein
MTMVPCSTTLLSSLPLLLRDLPSEVEPPCSAVAPATVAESVVCRTVTVRTDVAQLQADLERELRALLGFAGRLDR